VALNQDTQSPVKITDLVNFAQLALEAEGLSSEHAHLVADSLVQADLWGHQSHGVLRLPWYIARLRTGAMKASSEVATLVDTGAMLLLDGQDGVGQVLTDIAQREAVQRARIHGVGAVGVRNSNHFGTAMYYTRRAAAAGCVSILTTNASPAMAPWGGKEKGIGTNPWSIGAPYKDGAVVMDIANTAVARGKIYLARQRNEPIPDSWALTADGLPTTNAAEAVDGVILPMAGHKGYAISFMMDVLSGVLTGSASGKEVNGPYREAERSGCGHMFIALDVTSFGSPEEYNERLEQLIAEVKQTPLAHGAAEIFIPGEIEDRHEAARKSEGVIQLPEQTWIDLAKLGEETGTALPPRA